MPPHFDLDSPYIRLRVRGSDEGFPSLLEVSSFLYDFNLLYEVSRLGTDPNYGDFRFSNFVFYRTGRPLRSRDRLHVQALRQESPLLLIAVLAAAPSAVGALWGLVQIVEKVANAPLNRRKLRAEVEKLERENREAKERGKPSGETIWDPEQMRQILRIREAESFYDNVAGRLERSSVRISELDIEVVRESEESAPSTIVPPIADLPPEENPPEALI